MSSSTSTPATTTVAAATCATTNSTNNNNNNNSNKWGDKCITNISSLTETSSKESIQTFVKWIYFNRKHVIHFIEALRTYIVRTTTTTNTNNSITNTNSVYSILLTVLHEIFILHHSGVQQAADKKWELAADLRLALGESLLLDYANYFPSAKLETCMQQWDTYNSFGTPTLLRQLRTKLMTPTLKENQPTTATTTAISTITTSEPDKDLSPTDPTAVGTVGDDDDNVTATTTTTTASVVVATTSETDPVSTTATTLTNSEKESVPLTAGPDETDAMMIPSTTTPADDTHDDNTNNHHADNVVPATLSPPPSDIMIDMDDATIVGAIQKPNEKVVVAAAAAPIVVIDEDVITVSSTIPRPKRMKLKRNNDDDVVIVEKEKDDLDLLLEGKSNRRPSTTAISPGSSTLATTAATATKFDFEQYNDSIPAQAVNPNEFIEPCRLIATLQIARDLRNDSAVQISSLLQSLPESVRQVIAEAAERSENDNDDDPYEFTDATAREFIPMMNEQLLDMNMVEQFENVKTFMELIQRQRTARQTIHQLLIASRCQFGATDVAETYYSINDTKLKQRAQILADAMDLEGFEVQPVNPSISAMTTLESELIPFLWYQPNEIESSRVESATTAEPVSQEPLG